MQKKHRKEAERLHAAVKHLSKEFKKVSTDAQAKRGADARLLDNLQAAKAAVAEAEAVVAAGSFDRAALQQLQQLHAAKAAEVQDYEVRSIMFTFYTSVLGCCCSQGLCFSSWLEKAPDRVNEKPLLDLKCCTAVEMPAPSARPSCCSDSYLK